MCSIIELEKQLQEKFKPEYRQEIDNQIETECYIIGRFDEELDEVIFIEIPFKEKDKHEIKSFTCLFLNKPFSLFEIIKPEENHSITSWHVDNIEYYKQTYICSSIEDIDVIANKFDIEYYRVPKEEFMEELE